MKLQFRLLIFTGVLITLINCASKNRPTRCGIKLKNIECIPNLKWATNVSCRIKAIDRCTRVADFYAVPLKPLRFIDLHAKLYKRFSGWKPFLVEGDVSICNYLTNGKFNLLMKIIIKTLSKYTNLNHSCPINHPIVFANLNADVLDLGASIIPEGTYRLDINISEGKKENHVGLLRFYADIDEPINY